jgi:hypothetical protein
VLAEDEEIKGREVGMGIDRFDVCDMARRKMCIGWVGWDDCLEGLLTGVADE